ASPVPWPARTSPSPASTSRRRITARRCPWSSPPTRPRMHSSAERSRPSARPPTSPPRRCTSGWRTDMSLGLMARFGHRLPITDATPRLTLGEGSTPLVPAPALSARTGCEVFLKVEGANPTGSFQDRGRFLAVAKALEEGARAIVCASTGNTSASAAAYAARAGIACYVLIPDGAVALGKLAQAMQHGATVLQIAGNFDRALVLVRELGAKGQLAVVNSINPFRIEGQKTLAFEVIEALGAAPDLHFL